MSVSYNCYIEHLFHLDQFLLLDVATGVVGVLLAGAGHLHPLLTSVTVLLPTRLAVRLLLETIGIERTIEEMCVFCRIILIAVSNHYLTAALCLCVRLGLLSVLLAAHLRIFKDQIVAHGTTIKSKTFQRMILTCLLTV